jgi:hypothetical protein
MITAGSRTVRGLFSSQRAIDRPIEKVIDYFATDEHRLRAEVEEYEVTENVERNFERFLDHFGQGVRTGQVTETGIWVSGFYGSGKSSFTKYLGFALDPKRRVSGRPFLELLLERINSPMVRSELRTLATQEPAAVIMLDLGSEQLAESASDSVSTVLYWKVLQWAGFAKEKKLAALELKLEADGRLEEFKAAHQAQFGEAWEAVHDDPLVGIPRADQLVTRFYPKEYPQPGIFNKLRFSLALDMRDQVREMLEIIHRRSGHRNVLFLIDEAGQYVAPRRELILNLDGLARNIKELGRGRAWILATGQQTLSEIVDGAVYNSVELNKLRDRFPIALELDARDIREITWKRLLSKSAEGAMQLGALYRQHGQSLAMNTRLAGTALFKSEIDEQSFVRLYPFLPQHFDLLMELVRALAKRDQFSGLGLRSAIRVIQDVLVDTSKVLPAGARVLADAEVGRLATVDAFYDTLRADILKVLPHVVAGVDRVAQTFPNHDLTLRVAKAIAALQPIDNFPRNAEHLAALLYAQVGDAPHLDAVRATLRTLLDTKELGLVDDPQAGGVSFLSDSLKPIVRDRDAYIPTVGEVATLRSTLLRELFETQPTATLEGAKTVKAGVQYGKAPIVGGDEEVQFRLEAVSGTAWDARRTALLAETTGHAEWKSAIAWLMRPDESVEDALAQAIRSNFIQRKIAASEAGQDVAAYLRTERVAEQAYRERVRVLYQTALQQGTLIFQGNPTAAATAGATLEAAARTVLADAAARIYPKFHLVNIRPSTELAVKFLEVDRLDHMPPACDPLGFVVKVGGKPRVDVQHRALAEALRLFRELLHDAQTGRLQGNAIQDRFAAAPYGWSKDATRYVFAALLVAGELVLYTAAGPVTTTGPTAVEAMRNTQSFNKVGVGLRGSRPPLEALDRAAQRLQEMIGKEVLPLEDQISGAVREHLPRLVSPFAPLSEQLRLLGLAGEARAQAFLATGRDLLGQDGAAAIDILGAKDCSFPADLAWATAVKKALDDGAEHAINAARALLREVDDLAQLFPWLPAILETGEREALQDTLASEVFYERLADLRTLVRRVRERAAVSYREQWAGYADALQQVRTALEDRHDWTKISDADRGEIALGTVPTLPETPVEGQELSDLKLLLSRRSDIPRLRERLETDVARRVPTIIDEPGADDEPVSLPIGTVARSAVIHNDAELSAWLADLEARIRTSMEAGAAVHIVVRP